MANSPGGNNRKQWVCSVCDAPHYCRGYCSKHYQAWRAHGDPLVRLNREWPQPTYWAVHLRLGRQRGPAVEFRCTDCGAQADQWSYDHADPDALVGPTKPDDTRTAEYSADLEHYQPRCHSCHVSFDRAVMAHG